MCARGHLSEIHLQLAEYRDEVPCPTCGLTAVRQYAGRPYEMPCTRPYEVDPRSTEAKVGPAKTVPSITVRSVADFRQECQHAAASVRRFCRIAYRGQPREYCLVDRTISLLTADERGSTIGVYKSPGPFYDEPMCRDGFFREYLASLRLRRRREGGSAVKWAAQWPNRPQMWYELLALQGLVQHYGCPTVCVDVTSEPIVALWFALHERHSLAHRDPSVLAATYEITTCDYGIVYVLEVPAPYVGRQRKIIPNVLCLDLAAEVPKANWRPGRQSAMTISQEEWGVIPGDTFNRLASCIVKRLLVSPGLQEQLTEAERGKFNMRWLFPSYKEDPIYRHVLGHRLFKTKELHRPEWLIYPKYVANFTGSENRSSAWHCFTGQR